MGNPGYHTLQRRLDQAPQGAPASETLIKILEILLAKDEAQLVCVLPINLFTLEEASRLWVKPNEEARKILDVLADKGILFDFAAGGTQAYLLAPPMAGFFEFSLMRLDGRFDKKVLSELYYQYANVEEDLINEIFSLEPAIFRAFVQEDAIQEKDRAIVLDYERAAHIIDTSSCITVGTCYCRHKMEHVGRACNNPQDVCLTFNKSAESLAKHKVARRISKEEAHRVLNRCIDNGLVQLGDNVQESVNWICNCCSCCCEALLAYKRLGYSANISTNFVSKPSGEPCSECDICVDRCPSNAIELDRPASGSSHPRVDSDRCIGCGVCVRFCPSKSLMLERRKETAFVPKDSFERHILSAISTGKLQNLLLDNYTLLTHDLLRRFLKIVLSLKPAKMLLAQRQLQSRFLTALTRTEHYTLFGKLYNGGKKPDYSHPELRRTPAKSY